MTDAAVFPILDVSAPFPQRRHSPLTHLGFYAGWPKATKALAAVTKTLGK